MKMMKGSITMQYLTLVLEINPNNPCFFTVHVDRLISNDTIQTFRRPFNRDNCKKYLDQVGPTGSAIVKALADIEGITEIFISSYDISVQLDMAFDSVTIIVKAMNCIRDTIEPTFSCIKKSQKSQTIKNKHYRAEYTFTPPSPSYSEHQNSKVKATFDKANQTVAKTFKSIASRIKLIDDNIKKLFIRKAK